MQFPDASSWSEANFGSVDLGRPDRRARLVFSAGRLAAQPGASFPAVFTRKQLRCFYALMHRPEATPPTLLAGHFARTKQAMTISEPILIIHDTTEQDFTTHSALADQLGPIGDGRGRGLLQHNSLAVRARDGLLLGLVHQQLVKRQPRAPGETRAQRRKRPRESDLWQRGFEGVGPAPNGCVWVDVCDRGGDIFEALHTAVGLGHDALIRACKDRCIEVESTDDQEQIDRLMSFARQMPGRACDVVAIAQKGGRPARTAEVQLAGAPVWLQVPKQLPNRDQYEPLRVWLVRVWEPNPPAGADALEWILLSTRVARTAQQLRTCRDWYAWRWPIAEDYHQAEKTGCACEQVRFQDVESMQASLAVLSAVAVRVVQLRQVARACPDQPAATVAEPLEVAVLEQALEVPGTVRTVGAFVRGVAQLGGFLGRKCDGEPGWKTLWRGYQKLQLLVAGARLHQRLTQTQRDTPADRDDHDQHPP